MADNIDDDGSPLKLYRGPTLEVTIKKCVICGRYSSDLVNPSAKGLFYISFATYK